MWIYFGKTLGKMDRIFGYEDGNDTYTALVLMSSFSTSFNASLSGESAVEPATEGVLDGVVFWVTFLSG